MRNNPDPLGWDAHVIVRIEAPRFCSADYTRHELKYVPTVMLGSVLLWLGNVWTDRKAKRAVSLTAAHVKSRTGTDLLSVAA
jgi:hypothetical protein